jgi:hypothetical protein
MVRVSQIILLIVAINLVAVTLGQEARHPADIAPPPLKVIPPLERTQIDAADDPKSRVKITLALADGQLTNAETHSTQSDFAGASAAIGRYGALLEDVFSFLKKMNPESNKTRDLYKRVELALRAHGPRLTAMRRSTPAEYSIWIKEIEDFTRSGRTEALNSFYGHTVFREPGSKSSPKQEGGSPQQTSVTTEKKKP